MLVHLRRMKDSFRSSLSQTSRWQTSSSSTLDNTSKAERISLRVKERDSWTVYGQPTEPHPTFLDVFKLLRTNAWKLSTLVPPESELDEVFPVQELSWHAIESPPPQEIQITWMGHSSLLVQMNGSNILTDPIFSQRCSPSQLFGPLRYRQSPTSAADLCQRIGIDMVLISHNHYDHLDYATVKEIHAYSPETTFVVPLGVAAWFSTHISRNIPIVEMDWYEDVELTFRNSSIQVSSIPMRHWTSRFGSDRDKTLWCGYVLHDTTHQKKFLFPGDTAWFDAVENIGDKFGPIDCAAIPIGAYAPRDFMKSNHINVEEAVRMKDAVKAKHAVPIHWGTFPLTVEPVMEPRELLAGLMSEREDRHSFEAWLIGQTKHF